MNWHRVLFDTTYNYPGANGIKNVTGKWDNNNTKEFIFKRISDWLNQYFGEGHGITLGITETSLTDENDPMVCKSCGYRFSEKPGRFCPECGSSMKE